MESYYDTLPNFRYWDIEAWRNYIREYIVPIYETTNLLLELWNKLLLYVGRSLRDVKDSNEKIIPFFIGGIDENGHYKDRSLARLIRTMYGIYIDPKAFVGIIKEFGEEGFKSILVRKDERDPIFLLLIKNLNKFCAEVLQELTINSQKRNIDEIIQNPNKLLDILKELYKACVSFSANYNYYTFFIVSTGSLHWKYLITAYPRISEDLIEFLGLEPIFTPKTTDKEFQRDYTIWSHKPDGLAYNLYRIQALLWMNFNYEGVKNVFAYVVQEVEDLKESYTRFIERNLSTYTRISSIPGFEQLGAWEVEYYLKIGGPDNIFIVEYCNSYSPTYYKHVHKSVMCPLSEFLDMIAPELFLGASRISLNNSQSNELKEYELVYYKRSSWAFVNYIKTYYQIEW